MNAAGRESSGKPDAGNLHIRFDEGEGFIRMDAPSLLYSWEAYPRAFLAANDGAARRWLEGFAATFLKWDIPQLGLRVLTEAQRRFWIRRCIFPWKTCGWKNYTWSIRARNGILSTSGWRAGRLPIFPSFDRTNKWSIT